MSLLHIFSSQRQIRTYYEKVSFENALVDKALDIATFFDKILLNPKRKANEYESLLLMQQACMQTKNAHKLHIAPNFFAFLKNKEYLFSFFKELFSEKKSILDLKNQDYYAQYSEHLSILEELFKNYLKLLEQNNLYDDISIMLDYKLNKAFLKNYKLIIFHLDGFLTEFEAQILKQISKELQVSLEFYVSTFNLKALLKLDFLEQIKLELAHHYSFDLSAKKLIKKTASTENKPEIIFQNFELRSLQAAFVFDQISAFIRKGLRAKDIVIISPDENFAQILSLYDKNNMLNFATGTSIINTSFYQKLKALYESANDENFVYDENKAYFDDEKSCFDLHNSLLHYFKLEFKAFKKEFEKSNWHYFEKIILEFLQDANKELQAFVKEELLFLQKLFKAHKLKLKELLELFFMKLKSFSLSHNTGGEVTVMGLLESRGLEFKGLIIVDFNDDLIPQRSVNELFLNNEVRTQAGLISYEQRENLQRFYYESLIKKAQYLAISWVENEEKMPSRLLDELNLKPHLANIYSYKAYAKALAFKIKPIKIDLQPLKAPKAKANLFDYALSFSRFNSFLHSKRTYYYRYIQKLKEARPLKAELNALHYGLILHKLLEQVYKNDKKSFNEAYFLKILEENQLLNKLEKAVLSLKFKQFIINEKEHFKQGFVIKELEKNIEKDYTIKTLQIKLQGIIDRVDEDKNGNIMIIDYKSGKNLPQNSYQLAFYQALYDKNAKAWYYDLNTMRLSKASKSKSLSELEAKLLELYAQKDELIEFINEDKNKFCPYASIYEKKLK